MKQIISKFTYDGGFGAGTLYMGLTNGNGDWTVSATSFGGSDINRAQHPMSLAGSLNNLVIYTIGAHSDLVLTLYKNGSPTSLTVSVPSSSSNERNVVSHVDIAIGDLVSLQCVSGATPNFMLAFSVEFNTTPFQSTYGICNMGGSIAIGASAFGGILGNGSFQGFGGSYIGNTHSICSLTGNLTRMDVYAINGAPGAGIWTSNIVLNNVLQDGSGGTVDTTCIITGTATTGSSTFSLPLVPGDIVEYTCKRTGTVAPTAVQICASVAFTSAVDNMFMFCGGDNDAIDANNPSWRWTDTPQAATPESHNQAIVGVTPYTIAGMYVEWSIASGTGHSKAATLRVNSVDTAITVDVSGVTDKTGHILTDVAVVTDDLINIQLVPNMGGSGGVGQFHWGLIGTVPAIPDTASGIYKIVTDKRNDTLWVTGDVKIPDPSFKTGLIGG